MYRGGNYLRMSFAIANIARRDSNAITAFAS